MDDNIIELGTQSFTEERVHALMPLIRKLTYKMFTENESLRRRLAALYAHGKSNSDAGLALQAESHELSRKWRDNIKKLGAAPGIMFDVAFYGHGITWHWNSETDKLTWRVIE